jgi:DNA-binding transcriptional LysR family regulator
MASDDQVEAIRLGKLDAAFIFGLTPPPAEFTHRQVARHKLILAAPKGHPVTGFARLLLRDSSRRAFHLVSTVGASTLL